MMTRGRDLGWGLTGGCLFTFAYSAFVILLYLIAGPGPFERNGVTLGSVLLSYLFGGLAGGLVVGLLRPLTSRRLGAIAVGIIAATLVFVGIGIAVWGWLTRWDRDSWLTLATTSIIFGVYGGNMLWKYQRSADDEIDPRRSSPPA